MRFGDIVATIAAAIDGAKIVGIAAGTNQSTDDATIDVDTGVTPDGTLFGTAKDFTKDVSATDGDSSRPGATHGDPVCLILISAFIGAGGGITLATADNIAGAGVDKSSSVISDGPIPMLRDIVGIKFSQCSNTIAPIHGDG